MANRKFYAEKNGVGYSKCITIAFDSKKERDEYVSLTDYASAITKSELINTYGGHVGYRYVDGNLEKIEPID